MAGTGFWIILLACGIYGVIHSFLASLMVKRAAARRVGQAACRRFYRLFFVLLAVIMTLPLLGLALALPDRLIYAIPPPWVYLTLLLQAAAAVALLAGVLQTGALSFLGLRQMAEGDAPEQLVTGGLYRWVRHPLYSTSFVLLWLWPRMSWNVLALCLGLSAYMLIGSVFEERKLVAQFGRAYEAYRERTPRLLPNPFNNRA